MRAPTALIADDDLKMIRLLRVALEPLGVEIQEAHTSVAALVMINRAPPDLVILDVNMPGLEGPALAALIANLPLKRRPQAILWSAMAPDELRRIGLQAGLPTVQKVMSPIELASRLEKMAQNVTGKQSL
jgi:CheY-like chemotaxis protein